MEDRTINLFKGNVHVVKGQEVARKVGNAQATNVVMVGIKNNITRSFS